MGSFHQHLCVTVAAPRVLWLCALVALPGFAGCQAAVPASIEEGSETAGASPRPELPRSIALTPNARLGERELVSLGIPFAPGELIDPGLVRIVDGDGHEVARNSIGEVAVRGPTVMKGYWNQPEATAAVLRDGWMRSGDAGYMDEDGFLYIVDRLKDMIVSGGENIAGSEVERVLYEHSAVSEVAVVARPDERWGEVPVAFVALREGATVTADELVEHCRARLAKYKVPKGVTFIDALPRNPSGKVLKRELRTQVDG